MNIIYRISDTGYNKIKPSYIQNENCLNNCLKVFAHSDCNWSIIADNISAETNDMIQKYISRDHIDYVSVGHGAGTFNLALDYALQLDDAEIVYFIENDYLHKNNSLTILQEGFDLGAEFISLYDHPDKYINGINPYVSDGGEITKVFLSNSCHWKLTNSTTMTFAAKVNTIKRYESILRNYTLDTCPKDFDMWISLRNAGSSLITPIPGYSTHGETAWLSPLTNWEEIC
jgi:hypothetical protein